VFADFRNLSEVDVSVILQSLKILVRLLVSVFSCFRGIREIVV
jgi:hypothetical protein